MNGAQYFQLHPWVASAFGIYTLVALAYTTVYGCFCIQRVLKGLSERIAKARRARSIPVRGG